MSEVKNNTAVENEDDLFTFQKADESASEHIAAPAYSYWRSVFRQFFSNKLAIVMLAIVLFVVLMSIIQPMISGYDPMKTPNINNQAMKYIRPNAQYWFGTDDKGNSLFDAVWAGTRNSLEISFAATAIVVIVGVIVGMWWGFSKKVDTVMIEVYNVIANIPTTLIAMILVYALGGGKWQLIFALSITTWISVAYFIRVQVMIIRDREYNLASKCLGTSNWTIITKNILPYLVSVIMTEVSRDIPSFISSEVFFSYLGIGLSQKDASLGRMIREYSPYLSSTPYLFWIPVAVSAVISVSLYIVGQTLADASDPRTHMM
ncbi:MAG: ABC transporter permease [Solobacterium sp.]|jgi:oligopeptide transport system permease protein|nr:ABC transporter permease [Solobacterium sp.]MCH4048308.1 ABC transporter permease [Solobacterium sp.]MCH4074838.1 ABC transporter permease [Solobacterium sp.]MCI1314495.1 ABC transporter permease [Solobacterium sp.]MCI1346780.1 ABC transporter permease [Solobacterium sp.]